MESGWDPEVKKFFVKILNSIALGLLWMIAAITIGIRYELAFGKPVIYMILYYVALVISLFFLIRYFYRTWKSE